MTLVKHVHEFVKDLMFVIAELNKKDGEDVERIVQHLISRISEAKRLFKDAEERFAQIVKENERLVKNDDGTMFVYQNNILKAIVSNKIEKPVVQSCFMLAENCNCQFTDTPNFKPTETPIVIKNESELVAMDNYMGSVILEAFEHYYRTYTPFICWLGVYKENGQVFLIDCLKFKQYLPRLNLFKCGVSKIIHCDDCAKLIHDEFGDIGCYRNLPYYPKNIFVDWRIRPVTDPFISLMNESLSITGEKINSQAPLGRYVHPYEEISDDVRMMEFKLKNEIRHVIPFLDKILAFRDFLAKKFDESPNFIMNDDQILTLLERNPLSVDDFSKCLTRMSPILRIHATDILIILRKKHDFSLARLKEQKEEENDDYIDTREQFKKFGHHTATTRKTADSSFEISDDE